METNLAVAADIPKAIKVQGKRASQAWIWAQRAEQARADWEAVQAYDRAIEVVRKSFDGKHRAVAETKLLEQLREVLDRIERRGAEWGDDPRDHVPSAKMREAGAKGGAAGKGTHKVRRTRKERMGDF